MGISTNDGLARGSRWAWHLLGAVALAGGLPAAAWGQCACTTTLGPTENATPAAGTTVCIAAGTTYSGTLTISSDHVTVCNSGTITGTVAVTGADAVINNNNGARIATNNISLNAATTLNNGSSGGGAAAVWEGYLGASTITVAPIITNYGAFNVGIAALPGGTITNYSGGTVGFNTLINSSAPLTIDNRGTWDSQLTAATDLTITNTGTWNGYLGASGPVAITNGGSWTSQVRGVSDDAQVMITQNGGTWSNGDLGGQGSLAITNNALWTVGFAFPTGSANSFTTAAGATSSFDKYLTLNGTVALVNNGIMNLGNGLSPLTGGSSLLNAAGGTFLLAGDFTNAGTVVNSGLIAIVGNFTNTGTVSGSAALPGGTITATSYTSNSGSFGADGSFLSFCDGTPPNIISNGFDALGAASAVGGNVTFCGVLPVVLTSFTAQLLKGQVQARWATASEVNNQEFVVERSADGSHFATVQVVAGHGTTAHASAYVATDAEPLPGLSYYRLRQVDVGGASTYSPVVSVRSNAAFALPPPYPNPTAEGLTLDLRQLPAGPCEVRVLDVLGQLVLRQQLAAGQLQALALGQLPAGTYLLHLSSPTQGHFVQRITKQ